LPITNLSKSVPIKQLNASSGVLTISSPLTLKDVFTRIGQFVFSLNFLSLYDSFSANKSRKFILDNFIYGDIHWNKNGTKIVLDEIIKLFELN